MFTFRNVSFCQMSLKDCKNCNDESIYRVYEQLTPFTIMSLERAKRNSYHKVVTKCHSCYNIITNCFWKPINISNFILLCYYYMHTF